MTVVTYSLAGQAIAVRVTGDPDPTNNGLFYLHNDHLGSTSAMSSSSGQLVGEVNRYYPYGAYRSSGPNAITDRGFTGQKENAYIKLIDMRARWNAKIRTLLVRKMPYILKGLNTDEGCLLRVTGPQAFTFAGCF